jgi:2OG-Fe(II) oxygenase superfamily
MTPLLSFENLQFRYEPFPIGLAAPVMDDDRYRQMLDNFPELQRFTAIEDFGRKYALSEKHNPRYYRALVTENPVWREFYYWIKSPDFIESVLDALEARHIELGVTPRITLKKHLSRIKSAIRQGRPIRLPRKLRSRFEFSMLPADGGHLLPHTDSPGKIITIVVSMARPGEWDESLGGGTDINRPREPRYQYNYLNQQARFEDVEIIDTFEFRPNQAVVFVKTFNSWHSVRPMTGKGSPLMRRTLTINIEEF